MPLDQQGDQPQRLQYTPPIHPCDRELSPLTKTNTCPQCKGLKMARSSVCRKCRNTNARPPIVDEVFIVDGERCRKVPLTKGHYALVDESDYMLVMHFQWHVSDSKQRNTYYARAYDVQHREVRMHWLISGSKWVDHRNGDGWDNRKRNLRPCDRRGNSANSPKRRHNTSGYKGVRRCRKLWHTYINAEGAQHFIGSFSDFRTAALAYDIAAILFYGDFAHLNFPDEFI